MSRFASCASLIALLAFTGAASAAEPAVKISLSREDPDQQSGTLEGEGPWDFYVFVDKFATRGGEFSVRVEGGEAVDYRLDSDLVWYDPLSKYPLTISQATTDCYDYPVFFGTLTVQPAEPGGKVRVDVVPSDTMGYSVLLDCDVKMRPTFVAHPATANGEASEPYAVQGTEPLPPQGSAPRIKYHTKDPNEAAREEAAAEEEAASDG